MPPGGIRKRGSSSSSRQTETRNENDDVPTPPPRRGKKKEKIDAKKDSEGRIIISGDPKEGAWFGHPDVIAVVGDSIRSNFNVFVETIKKCPRHIMEQWWNYFKNKTVFNSILENDVRDCFVYHLKRRLRDILHHTPLDKKPIWFSDDSFAQLISLRNSARWKRISVQAKANRAKYMVDGKIPGTHNMGSISSVETADRIARSDPNGDPPSAYDLFLKMKCKDGKFIDPKAPIVAEKYNLKKTELEAANPDFNKDELFLECAGGFQNGHVYGLGNAAEVYFKRPNCSYASSQGSSNATYGVGILSRSLQNEKELKEENRQIREAAKRDNEFNDERFRQTNEQIKNMQEQIAKLLSQSPCSEFPSHFHRDPHQDGSSGANASFPLV